jgi:hypothetical protein
MAEEKTYVFGNDSANSLPLAYALNGNGWNNGGYGLGGWGGGIVGFLLGLAFGGFGNGFGGFGGFGGNGLGGLVNSDSNRDVVLQAINGTDADVRQLASTLGMNYETISQGITDARLALANVGSQVGMSGLQIQNAILSGDASIVAKLQECCCENRLLTTEQGYQAQIRTIEQTNTLGSQADRNTAALTSAINAFHNDMTREFCEVREREMSDKIDTLTAANTALRNQIDNANQTAAVAAMLAPIQKEVSDIRAAQPATTTVTYPQLTAVPSYMLYGNGSYYGGYPYFYGGNGSIWA